MKKINKKILLATTFVFVSLSSVLTSAVLSQNNNSKSENENFEDKKNEDKKDNNYIESVKSELNNYFSTLENENSEINLNLSFHYAIKTKHSDSTKAQYLNSKSIPIVKSFSNDFVSNYLTKIKSESELNDIFNDYLKDRNIDISEYKDKIIDYQENKTNLLSINELFLVSNQSFILIFKTVSQISDEFIKASKDSFIVAGVAAAAAAGFWAASWWFGVTIPWALAASSAAFAYSIQGGILLSGGLALKSSPSWVLAQTLDNLKMIHDYYGYYSLVKNIRDVIKASKILKNVESATSWAVPIVKIVAFALEEILNNYGNY